MADSDRRGTLLDSYENAAVIVSGIDADELGYPTPCPRYDVAGLIDHLVEAGQPVVYNGVHMMTAETDENSREAWIASLDAVAALNPQIVVAGHKSVGAPDLPESIGASQQYLRDFSRIVNEGGSVEDVVNAMLKPHGDRDNPRTLWHSARTAVAKRG
jgi:hypothetical protein